MFIAVEGPTCVGKSTLVNRLVKELGNDVELHHKDRPKELTRRWVLGDYVLNHEGYLPGKSDIVSDRWHFGERTYAAIYRTETNRDGYGLLGQAGWRWVEMFLASRGAVIASLTADNDTLTERLASRGDDHVTSVHELLQVSSLYELARRESNSIGAIYDASAPVNEEKFDRFVENLLTEARLREAQAEKLLEWTDYRSYLGAVKPDVLLVGDARNVTEKYGEETQLPFMPVDGNSGEFLLNALPSMFWRSVGIVNGTEVSNVGELWELLGKPPIVALGRKAEEALGTDFMLHEFATLPHPQWVRRFANSRQTEYGKAIQHVVATGKIGDSWKL